MLEYNAILYKKHGKPVISVVIYPFRVKLPKAPLRIFVKKKTAEARVEGEIEALRQVVIEIVQTRFPALAGLTQQGGYEAERAKATPLVDYADHSGS